MKLESRTLKSVAGLFLSAFLSLQAGAQTLLYKDNFDTANTNNLDNAPLTGRLTGTLATTVHPRSAKALQAIAGNQLSMVKGGGAATGRIRFHSSVPTWYNWALSPEIVAAGGMRVEFDWTPPNTTGTDGIGFAIGFPTAANEPDVRSTAAPTDYGIRLRNDGTTEQFNIGASIGTGTPYTPVAGSRHVVIDFAFLDFNDGTNVITNTYVGGIQVATDEFTWAGNGGASYMELETFVTGQLIDNYTVSTLSAGTFSVTLAGNSFLSGLSQGAPIGTLTGTALPGGPEPTTFTLVSGTGSTHNSRFQINGDQLEVGTYDFKQDPAGSQYFIRVRGQSSSNPGHVSEKELVLSLIKDDDLDGLLDPWEIGFAGNITSLNGLASGPGPGAGTGDFDGDGITDLTEYGYSNGAYPGISPILADTDGDGLNDGEEITPTGTRVSTRPTRADSDGDGANDFVESNSGTYAPPGDIGSNPNVIDTDFDGARDGFEQLRGSNPVSFDSRPPLPTGYALVPLTGAGASDISTAKTYTHAISGGEAKTINGVAFQGLTTTVTPTNLTWTVAGAGSIKQTVVNLLNTWNPATGGLTNPDLINLFDSFAYAGPAVPGSSQTFTLSGLTPGQLYQVRLYIRPWDVFGGTGRPIDLIFTNGATVTQPLGGLFEDRAGLVLNNDNPHSAYYLSYTYVAESTELLIKGEVFNHPGLAPTFNSGGFHFFGLTNEVVAPAGTALVVKAVSWNNSGELVIDFTGAASTVYKVTKSPDLVTPFGPLTVPLTETTDPSGVGQAVIPSSEASESKEFYRIELP